MPVSSPSPLIFFVGLVSAVDSAVLFLSLLVARGGLLIGEFDWSLLSALLVAARACAAIFPGELEVEDSFLKKKLPVGRS